MRYREGYLSQPPWHYVAQLLQRGGREPERPKPSINALPSLTTTHMDALTTYVISRTTTDATQPNDDVNANSRMYLLTVPYIGQSIYMYMAERLSIRRRTGCGVETTADVEEETRKLHSRPSMSLAIFCRSREKITLCLLACCRRRRNAMLRMRKKREDLANPRTRTIYAETRTHTLAQPADVS